MTPKQARELSQVFAEVEGVFLAILRDGNRHPMVDLREAIPEELAERRHKLTPSWIAPGPDRGDTIVGTYRHLLAVDVVNDLAERGICELQLNGGPEAVRLVPPTTVVPEVPAGAKKTKQDAEHTSPPAKASSRKKPGNKPKAAKGGKSSKTKGKAVVEQPKPATSLPAKPARSWKDDDYSDYFDLLNNPPRSNRTKHPSEDPPSAGQV